MNTVLVNQITNECCDVLEEMLQKLGVRYAKGYRRLYGACPIHGGDNPSGWNIYPEGDEVRGIWECYTHGCHVKWKKTLVGFVHAVLAEKDPNVKWTDAVLWMANFLGYKDVRDVKLPSNVEVNRQRLVRATQRLATNPVIQTAQTWRPESFRKQVKVPSSYYLDRGYLRKTLVKYDVGYADRSNRSVVPIYDLEHTTIIGMTARTHHPKCLKCGHYHDEHKDCPTTIEEQYNACKWKNSPGFESSQCLYNLWFSKPHIEKTSTIVLVEGPGDVWRLEEAGIHNSVAIFGTDLSDSQLQLLDSTWSMNAVVLTDGDEAGQKAARNIAEKLRRTHRLYFPNLSENDVGDLCVDKVTNDIKPMLTKIYDFQCVLRRTKT